MSIKLSDTQLLMLSAAAQREDRCLVAPKSLKGGAAQKIAAKFLAAGLVKEIKAKPGTPVWRRDDEAGRSYLLKLTAAGLRAIAVDESGAEAEADELASPAVGKSADAAAEGAPASSALAPRDGTKLAQVVGLIQRDHGATLAELVAATGWLPHTARAALTGLRKRGYGVTLDRSDAKRSSIYRIDGDRGVREGESSVRSNEPTPRPAARSTKAGRLAASSARQAA
jgi:DNA-binding MarR family transcriptional regulator